MTVSRWHPSEPGQPVLSDGDKSPLPLTVTGRPGELVFTVPAGMLCLYLLDFHFPRSSELFLVVMVREWTWSVDYVALSVLAELVLVIQVFTLSVMNSENERLDLTSRLNHIKWIIAKFPLYMLLVLRLMSHPSPFQGDNITTVSHSSPVGSHIPRTYVGGWELSSWSDGAHSLYCSLSSQSLSLSFISFTVIVPIKCSSVSLHFQ